MADPVDHVQRRGGSNQPSWYITTALLIPLAFYSPLNFAISTLSRTYIAEQFGESAGDTSFILGWSGIPAMLVTAGIQFFKVNTPRRLVRRTDAESSSPLGWDLSVGTLFLLLAWVGSIFLAFGKTLATFEAGLAAMNVALLYPSYSRSILTMCCGPEHIISVLLRDQVFEAVGRMMFVPGLNWLSRLGGKDDPALPYYGVLSACALSFMAILWVYFCFWKGELSVHKSAQGFPESTDRARRVTNEETPLLVADELIEPIT
ncbi:hypothetical protein B0T19DRAFT_446516 [Cercophora scortea]|uniref:Uncharacterized protein n=1 Tax=Cercophora scortea TaxID=314031 RepID=A0AAE0M3C0_9PEZI|nr:hypothetical protein B0T19DRAFT_446516 [Cercophora scortea]